MKNPTYKKDQWELFDLVNDPYELRNLYGQPGQDSLTASLKQEVARLKRAVRDDDQLAGEQLPNGVDGTVARLRGKSGVLLPVVQQPQRSDIGSRQAGGGGRADIVD